MGNIANSADPKSAFEEAIRAHEASPLDEDAFQRVLALGAENPEVMRQIVAERAESAPAFVPRGKPEAESGGLPGEITAGAGPYSAPPRRAAPATNWGSNVALGASEVRQPANGGQAASALQLAVKSGMRARAIGASHSASMVMATPGMLVDTGTLTSPETSAVNSLLRQCRELVPRSWYKGDAGPLAQLVEVGSGARVQDVVDYLTASNRALPMTGSYTGQTLVGAFMTSTHGAGVIHPPLHAAVRSIQMLVVNASGEPEELRIEPSAGITDPVAYTRAMPQVSLIQDDTTFLAAVVSMGCMGVVLSVIIETVPPYSLVQETMVTTWREARAMLLDADSDGVPSYFQGTYNGGVLLSPYPEFLSLGGMQRAVMSRTRLAETRPSGAGDPTSSPVSALLTKLAQAVGNGLPALVPLLLNYTIGTTSTETVWGPGNVITGSATELPVGYSAEHGFPLKGLVPAMDALLARMLELAEGRPRRLMVGPISIRYVGATGAFLSMTQGGDRAFTEILTLAGAGLSMEVLEALEPLALEMGSRPHWGQWFSGGAVARMVATYPEYEKWKSVWKRLDPTGAFHSSFTDQLP
ncbi:MAG: D-arabinono-1,4-lactone oxidase [Polyangiaceae bacterium]